MRKTNGQVNVLPTDANSVAIEELRDRLAEWRRTRKPPSRIPEELWAMAVQLAGQHGVGKIARIVRLDYAALRKRLYPRPAAGAAAFVEWLSPVATSIGECSLEVRSSRGSHLLVHMKNVAPVSLAAFIREFAG